MVFKVIKDFMGGEGFPDRGKGVFDVKVGFHNGGKGVMSVKWGFPKWGRIAFDVKGSFPDWGYPRGDSDCTGNNSLPLHAEETMCIGTCARWETEVAQCRRNYLIISVCVWGGVEVNFFLNAAAQP